MKTYPLQLTLQELTLLFISLSNRPLVTSEVMEQIQITIDLAKCDQNIEGEIFAVAGKFTETTYTY